MEEKDDTNKLIIQNESNEEENPPIPEETKNTNKKKESITVKKTKPSEDKMNSERKKLIKMYVVFSVYLLISILLLVIIKKAFLEKIQKIFKDNQSFTFLLYIISIVASIFLSGFISYYECLIKMHFFGILFVLILSITNNYFIIYSSEDKYFFEFLASLIILCSGSIGLLIITLIIKDGTPSDFNLYLFNAIFSSAAGAIIYFIIKKNFFIMIITLLSIFISVFNVYSSQYKSFFMSIFNKENKEKDKKEKKLKKETLIYSQPFELNISAFKFIALLISFVIKFIKLLFKCCSKNNKSNKGKGTEEIINKEKE